MNNGLERYRQRLRAALWTATEQSAAEAARLAREAAPLGEGRDGHLRDGIRPQPAAWQGDCVSAGVTADSPHALYVELGTSRMRAQPYLRPAALAAFRALRERIDL